jgi:polyhydroxybutyrate depolymerase
MLSFQDMLVHRWMLLTLLAALTGCSGSAKDAPSSSDGGGTSGVGGSDSGGSDSGGSDSGGSDSGGSGAGTEYKYFAGDHAFSLSHGGLPRDYFVHVPPSYDGSHATAVIINLHGGTGSAETAKAGSQMDASADAAGYLVVYPEAREVGAFNKKKWNNGPRAETKDQGVADDVGFVAAMLDALATDFAVDTKRIFATGISNGGMMAYRLACELSDRIAAAAPIASQRMVDPCTPSRPISVIHFHGLEDGLVPHAGGPSSSDGLGLEPGSGCPILFTAMALADDMMSAESSIGAFATRNNCPGTPSSISHGAQAECRSYGPCDSDSAVVLCTMADSGHTWPGGAYEADFSCFVPIVGAISQDINANNMMWTFFQEHPLTM